MLIYHFGSSRRHRNEYSPHAVKRQRTDSSPQPLEASPLSWAPLPLCRPDEAVAGSSRSSVTGFDYSFPGPHLYIHPQGLSIPESSNSLRSFAKDKVYSDVLTWSWCMLIVDLFARRFVWLIAPCMCLCFQLSGQMVALFEACQQQTSDLERKEMCRARLQQDIQHVYAGVC